MIPAESLEHTVAEYEVRLAEKRVEVIEWRNAANAAGKRIVELRAERDALRALLPGVYYMDPPDGGDVDIVEQFRRMAEDASRWRWWCNGRRDGLLSTQWNEWADRNRARAGKGAT